MSEVRYCDPQTQYEIEMRTIRKVLQILDAPDCKKATIRIIKAWRTFELKRTK